MTNNEKATIIQELKKLRGKKQEQIQRVQAMVKEQKKILTAVTKTLQQGPKTIPELAASLQLPTEQTLWYVAAMKKYGQILEGDKKGDYFTYCLATVKTNKPA